MSAYKVLVLEDDRDDFHLLSLFMQKLGSDYELLERVETLKDLARECHLQRPDLIVCDLGLPECEGTETLLRVRAIVQNTPIIVLTGSDDEQLGERVVQLGAQDYLPKDELSATMLRRSIRFSIERHQLMSNIREQAETDHLTLLFNRRHFEHSLSTLVAAGSIPFALFVLDLDAFKPVNDTYGHHAGDAVLEQMGQRLRRYQRKGEQAARIGGDEFAILLPHFEDEQDIEKMALRVIDNLSRPYSVYVAGQIHSIHVGVSVGVALYPRHGMSAGEMLQHADDAMYQAKNDPEGPRWCLYKSE